MEKRGWPRPRGPGSADEVHADLLSSETSAAPEVLAVLTAEDARRIGGNPCFGYILPDCRMLVGKGDRVRCNSDVIALVIAATRAQARSMRRNASPVCAGLSGRSST